jgi:poly(3-hydroxybutyrate) depolymerase
MPALRRSVILASIALIACGTSTVPESTTGSNEGGGGSSGAFGEGAAGGSSGVGTSPGTGSSSGGSPTDGSTHNDMDGGGSNPPPGPTQGPGADGAPNASDASFDGSAPPVGADGGIILPVAQGTCPDFTNGVITMDVGGTSRSVTLSMDATMVAAKHGPLILYWYSTYHTPAEAQQALPVSQITAAGGIVAAPTHINSGQFPWIGGMPGEIDKDYALADQIVACAIQKVGIDTKHIHSNGFSAGALFTTFLSFKKSGYLASVATYSGGLLDPPDGGPRPAPPPYDDPFNKFAAMIMTGGVLDTFPTSSGTARFNIGSQNYQNTLKMDGHSAIYCDHGGGHSIPAGLVASVWQFFQDHSFGTNPSPYVAKGLPSGFTGCSL